MTSLIKCMRSDLQKFKHSPIYLIHILVPMIASILFLSYYSFANWKTETKISSYFEVIAIALPLLISLICSIAIEQESQAGNFQLMLSSVKSRSAMLLSKFTVLLFLGTFSIILAIGTFAVNFKSAPNTLYLKAIGILILSNILIYIIHMLVSLNYGKGASIGLGIAESLLCAITLTGLGDGIWHYIPCSWGARLCDCIVFVWSNPCATAIGKKEIIKSSMIALPASIIGLILMLVWFSKWEGRNNYD